MNRQSFFRIAASRFGFEFGLLLMAALAAFYLITPKIISESATPVSLEVLASADQLASLLHEAEQNQQAFLAYKQPAYLQQYNHQIADINEELRELQQNPRVNKAQKLLAADLAKKVRTTLEQWNFRLRAVQGLEKNTRNVAQTKVDLDFVAFKKRITLSQDHSLFSQLRNKWVLLTLAIFASVLMILSRIWHRADFQKQTRENKRLQQRSVVLDHIINSMNEAVIVTDENAYFTHYNAAAQKIIGTKIKEVASDESSQALGFFDSLSKSALTKKDLPFHKALRGIELTDEEFLIVNKTHPEGLMISASSRSLRGIDGSLWGTLVVLKDITRRYQAEQDWIAAREAALDASRQKSEFLAEMSHEIRTPMNGVLGMTTLLKETPLNSEQKDYVGVIQRSANSLLMLINDILDHSKIEAGKVDLVPQVFDLNFVAREALEIFQPQVTEKNIGLELEWQETSRGALTLPRYVLGDAGRLRQILVNLLGNAVKFTDRGRVQLEVSLLREGEVLFEVKDSGPGLRDEEAQSLFQKYFQTTAGRKAGGTGLGLSICKKLVDLMGGQIGVRSVLGQGTCFWFSLPLRACAAPTVALANEVGFSDVTFHGRILVAEDQAVNQRVITTYLHKLGLDVDVAVNGKQAVEKYLERHYELILMDCQMPVMSGHEATRTIHHLAQEKNQPVPAIIALTAQGTEEQKRSCQDSGMVAILTKPLELQSLIEVLREHLPSPSSSTVAASNSQSLIDLKILMKLNNYQSQDKSLVEALIQDYEESTPALIEEMKNAFLRLDPQGMRDAAHALFSASATLGAHVVAQLCRQLENDPRPLSELQYLLEQLESSYHKSLAELKRTPRLNAA